MAAVEALNVASELFEDEAVNPIEAMIGVRFNGIIVVKNLAIGTYGAVYLAERITNRERMAVKCMFKTGLRPEHLRVQHAEIAVNQLVAHHRNVVALLDTYEDDERLCLVFEYAARGDLFDLIRREEGGIYDKLFAQRLFLELIDGVEHCHANSVFHRDIKPENVLLAEDWTAKLADFGLASTTRFVREYGCGSPPYMAPETVERRSPTYDAAAADVWSLGIVFFNMLYGLNPWEKAVASDRRFASYIKHPTSYLPSRFAMSSALAKLFRGVFAVDPSDRFNLAELRQHVEALDLTELSAPTLLYGTSPAVSLPAHSRGEPAAVSRRKAGSSVVSGPASAALAPAWLLPPGIPRGDVTHKPRSKDQVVPHRPSPPKVGVQGSYGSPFSFMVGSWADDEEAMDYSAPVVFEDKNVRRRAASSDDAFRRSDGDDPDSATDGASVSGDSSVGDSQEEPPSFSPELGVGDIGAIAVPDPGLVTSIAPTGPAVVPTGWHHRVPAVPSQRTPVDIFAFEMGDHGHVDAPESHAPTVPLASSALQSGQRPHAGIAETVFTIDGSAQTSHAPGANKDRPCPTSFTRPLEGLSATANAFGAMRLSVRPVGDGVAAINLSESDVPRTMSPSPSAERLVCDVAASASTAVSSPVRSVSRTSLLISTQ